MADSTPMTAQSQAPSTKLFTDAAGSARWFLILAGLLVLQIVLAGVMLWPRPRQTAAGAPLFADFAPEDVADVTVADSKGQQVHVARNDGGQWVLPDADDYPVLEAKVSTLLDKIATLKQERLVARTPASYAQLGVAEGDFVRRVDLKMADGSQHTLYIGTAPRVRSIHIRSGDQKEVYLALNLNTQDASSRLQDWIDIAYFHIAESKMSSMTLENPNGVFEFSRNADGDWQMAGLAAGEEFNPNNLLSLLTSLSSLNMVEPLGKEEKPEYGLDAPTVVVTVVYDDGGTTKTATLRVGALNEKGNRYYAASSESPYYVQIAKTSLDRFVERTREEFLVQPEAPATETPTAVPTPGS